MQIQDGSIASRFRCCQRTPGAGTVSQRIIKSVGRVFGILELFDRERRALSATDVSRALSYPHSSTVALLKSMLSLGYLTAGPGGKTFQPSTRLGQVVEWITTDLQDEVAALGVMKDLHETLDETINLSRQMGDFVTIVRGLESTRLLGIRVREGAVMPLTTSHSGRVVLATYTDEEVRRIVTDQRQRAYPGSRLATIDQILAEVRRIRREELSPGYNVMVDGIGIVAFALKSQNEDNSDTQLIHRPLVVAVAGPTDRIRRSEQRIIRAARRAIARHNATLAYPREGE